MISSAAQNGMEETAIEMFCEMLELGFSPNEFSYSSLIQACSNAKFVSVGGMVLGSVIKMGFFKWDVSVGCALTDMFAKNQDLVSARKVFDRMFDRNLVAWTLMITRYGQHGHGKEAIDLFVDMVLGGFEPDRFTISGAISACIELESVKLGQQLHSLAIRHGFASNVCIACSLVNMYAKCAAAGVLLMDDWRKVFDQMSEHNNVMSWTAVISGYVQSGGGHDEEAIKLFCEMMQGSVRPNHFTYSSILKACASLSDPEIGGQVHAHVMKSGVAPVNFVGNSLFSMYARSGKMEDASKAFDVLYEKNIISYNAIADGYLKNSNAEEALELIHDIGVSAFTFASLLSSTASIGMVSKGQQLHAQLLKVGFGSDRGIGNSLLSMYSRCGNIEDACQVFDEMDDRNVISWTSMITGFAKHGYANRALGLFHEMISTGAKPNEVTSIAVLSACGHVGLVKEGWEHFYTMQRDHGSKDGALCLHG